MDLSQMSDAELEAIANGQPAASGPDLSSMSDDELQKIASGGQAPDILQEQHPEFSLMDRLAVKNFANNNEASVNYLQKQHPDLEVKVDDFSGQILARKRDGSEKAYRVLDPDQGFFGSFSHPLEALKDIGDSAYDIGSGIGTTAATAAGGLAGAATGPGALAAAAGSGAAASGGLEALRQLVGRGMGINPEISGTDIGLATGVGAISPLLFGTGATATQIAEKSMNPFAGALRTITGEATPALDAADKQAMSNQNGLAQYVGGKIAKLPPLIGSKISGINQGKIEHLIENPGVLKAVNDKGLFNYSSDAASGLTKDIVGDTNKLGAGLRKQYEGLSALRKMADQKIAEIGPATVDPESGLALGALKAQLESQPEPFYGLMGQRLQEIENAAKQAKISSTTDAIENAGKNAPLTEGALAELASTDPTIKTLGQLRDALSINSDEVRKPFDNLIAHYESVAKTDGSKAAQEELAYIKRERDALFKEGGKLDANAGWQLKKRLDKLGRRFATTPGTGSTTPAAMSQVDKDLMNAAKEGVDLVNERLDSLGHLVGADIAGDNAAFSKKMLQRKYLKNMTKDPEAAYRFLSNLQNDPKIVAKQRVEQWLDPKYADRIIKASEDLATHKAFNSGNLGPVSSGGTTSTSRSLPLALGGFALGGMLGSNTLGPGGGRAGAIAGGLLGAIAGGPAALRAYMALGRGVRGSANFLKNSGVKPMQNIPTWLLLQDINDGNK